jgi:hypothetical protein
MKRRTPPDKKTKFLAIFLAKTWSLVTDAHECKAYLAPLFKKKRGEKLTIFDYA